MLHNNMKKWVSTCNMKNILMFIFIVVGLASTVSAEVVIQQVYYTTADDSNDEFVLLKNTGDDAVNVSDWTLQKPTAETSSTAKIDARLPDRILAASELFLIADTGWNTDRTEQYWPLADVEDALTLNNDNTGIVLVNAAGQVVDAVGWGDETKIDSFFYEGTPHEGVGQRGFALHRTQDTDNNTADFAINPPILSSDTLSVIPFTITVVSAAPTIHEIIFSDDNPQTEGNQILPLANNDKEVELTVITDATEVTAEVFFERNTATPAKTITLSRLNESAFNTSFSLTHFSRPGEYSIALDAINERGTTESVVTFTYLPLLAFSIDNKPFVGEILQGQSQEYTTTLENIGNVALDTQLWITESQLDIEYKEGVGNYLSLNATPIDVNLALAPEQTHPLLFRFNITTDLSPNIYNGAIHISASSNT